MKIRIKKRKFVAVIGGRHFGKSTIIKSLTGCPKSLYEGTIEDEATHRKIYVICCSPQESGMGRSRLQRIFKKVAADRLYTGLVMAIQPTKPSRRISLEEIFQAAKDHGFESHAVILNPGRSSDTVDQVGIAQRLVGFSIQLQVLDGRRFAHINADLINLQTKIVF